MPKKAVACVVADDRRVDPSRAKVALLCFQRISEANLIRLGVMRTHYR